MRARRLPPPTLALALVTPAASAQADPATLDAGAAPSTDVQDDFDKVRLGEDTGEPMTTGIAAGGPWFLLERHRGALFTAELDGEGAVTGIGDLKADTGWLHPHDAAFGPEGSPYVLECGSGWFGPADDNGLYRIDYVGEADVDPCPPQDQPRAADRHTSTARRRPAGRRPDPAGSRSAGADCSRPTAAWGCSGTTRRPSRTTCSTWTGEPRTSRTTPGCSCRVPDPRGDSWNPADEGSEIATSGPPSSDWQDDPYYFTAEDTGTCYIYCTPHAGTSDPDPANWTGMVARFEVLPPP